MVITNWRAIVVTISLMFSLASPTRSQWRQTAGPFGAAVSDLTISGGNLVAAGGRVFVSQNLGAHWSSTLSVPGGVGALAAGGGARVWAGASHGVLLSTDGGMNWADVTTATVNDYVNAITADSTQVLAAEYAGLFRSTDLGISWQNIGAGLPSTYANTLLIDGSAIWIGLENSPHALYRSSDGGQSWVTADSGLTPKNVRSIIRFGGRLFSSTWGGGVFVSKDNGASWTPTSSGITGSIVRHLYAFGNVLCANSDYGVYISADTGKSWTGTADLPMWGYGAISFASIGTVLFAGGADGVHASTNRGAVWELRDEGMIGTLSRAIVAVPGGLAAGTYTNGVAISTDGGASWKYSNAGLPGHLIRTLYSNGSLLLEGGNIGAYRSTDSGVHWSAANNGFGAYNSIYGFFSQPPLLYCAGDIGIFASSDSGASWTKVSTGLPVKPVHSVFIVSTNGPTLMAGTYDTLYRSSNGGSAWIPVKQVVADEMVRFGSDLYAATQSGVMISTDEGVTWNSANQNINPLESNAFAIAGGNLFLACAAGVFRTTGRNAGWTAISDGLPPVESFSLVVDGGYLYSGGGPGVWKRPLSEIVTGAGAGGLLPVGAALEQNYPNPFNPSTTIRYGLPQRSSVTLTVFNTIGQKVMTLVQETQAPGYHEVKFDGSTLGSGVYFYRMQAGSFVQTKKLLLVR